MRHNLPEYLTVAQAAKAFGINQSTLTKQVQRGDIPSRIFVKACDVASWKVKRQLKYPRQMSPLWIEVHKLRTAGWNDAQIGGELGITRERVRQMRDGMELAPVRNYRTRNRWST